jgi:hypothetical protein
MCLVQTLIVTRFGVGHSSKQIAWAHEHAPAKVKRGFATAR